MNQIEILKQVRSLISNPDNWTQLINARDKNDNIVSPSSVSACQYCVNGAILKVIGAHGSRVPDEYDSTLQALKPFHLGYDHLTRFNDAEETTHVQVISLLNRAIYTLEARQRIEIERQANFIEAKPFKGSDWD